MTRKGYFRLPKFNLCSNIHKVEVTSEMDHGEDHPDVYEWDEVQYTKDEYLVKLQSDFDYLSMMMEGN